MVAATSGRWTRYRAHLVVGSVVIGVLACASPQGDAPVAPAAADAVDRLTDVRVESGEDGTVVTLLGLEDPIYTAFLHTDPRALVLDIASVEIDTANDLVMVYDGLVENVSLSTYGGSAGESLTRVEIALSAEADYDIAPTPEGLRAEIVRGSGEGAAAGDEGADATMVADEAFEVPEDAEAEEDPWADAETLLEDTEAALQEPSTPPPAATALTAIHSQSTGEGVLIHLEADGAIGALETFTLENPDRLVVDLPGIESKLGKSRVEIDGPLAKRARIGKHEDKLRIVIDGGEGTGSFESRRVAPAANGLFLALGDGMALEDALAGALDEAQRAWAALAGGSEPFATDAGAEMAPAGDESGFEMLVMGTDEADESGSPYGSDEVALETEVAQAAVAFPGAEQASTQVYGIHYDHEEEYERVVILSDEIATYDIYTPDPETVVISIYDARVAPEASGRVLVEPRRPISLISTFQQPDVDQPEVRVVIKRASDLEPTVLRRGSMLFVDFPNTGRVAAPPPAFPDEHEAGAVQQFAIAEAARAEATGIDSMVMADAGEFGAGEEALEALDDAAETGFTVMGDTADLPEFSENPAFDGPAGMDADLMSPPRLSASAPAALEPPAAADILQEGGLIDGKEYAGRRISLDFKDVPVADVLRLIAEVSDLNLIAGDEVDGNVTIRLVDVPWDQALDVILLTKGLGFVRVGNVLRIAPADIIKAEEELRLQERRNKETLEDLVVKLQPVNYASVADMAELVKRILTPRGTVNVDVRTNTLIIKDIPSVIDEATALVKAIDTETPQVLIEAKIVEAALDFSRELGSVWSVGTNQFEDGFGGNAPRRDLGGPDFRFHDANNVIVGNPITSIPTAVANMNAFVLNEKFNVNVQIQAAEATGDGKVISSPRILTLDNREAEIQQGVSIPFQTFENGDAKLEFIDAVLSLLVTPHVTSDKTIIMQIEVTRNAPDDSVPTPTGSPAIARAEARTETLVKDGQTLVIGGIYTVNKSERESRVPYLHRVPVIGSAFKSREMTDQRKELLIFVTPRIVLATELADS